MNKVNKNTDVVIVGAGPSGIFTAIELVQNGFNGKITMVEKGHFMESRKCPKNKTSKCAHCEPCNITTGFSGAGAFSDGKLSLSADVGGDFPSLIGYDTANNLIRYTGEIYKKFGAKSDIIGYDEYTLKTRNIIEKDAIKAGLKLVDCPILHLGTECAQKLYTDIEHYLLDNNVLIYSDTVCKKIKIDKNTHKCTGITVENEYCEYDIDADIVIISTGRRGADWLFSQCEDFGIKHTPGTMDIGVRVEVVNSMASLINVLYESKLIGYPEPFKDKVRTFCQNPGGYVTQENYDDGLAVVNGHSYKNKKSKNTNLAILSSHNFTTPFNKPIEYAKMVGRLTNMLGGGQILVQRFGDILSGRRSWEVEGNRFATQPTLSDAVYGDITAAMPYRTMTNIIEFIKMLDKVEPGFASYDTLLYSPELKFYSNKIEIDKDLKTNIKNLYCLGDSSGWTRGLMMASMMGVCMAHKLIGDYDALVKELEYNGDNQGVSE